MSNNPDTRTIHAGVLFGMIYRSLAALTLVCALFFMTGCLDNDAKADIDTTVKWIDRVLGNQGDLLVVHRDELTMHRDALTGVLSKDTEDWSFLETLLGMLGVGGTGTVVIWINRMLRWRTVAYESIKAVEDAKVQSADGKTYTLDKDKLRKAMSSRTVQEIERIRDRVAQQAIRAASAAKLRADVEKMRTIANVD